MIGVGPAGGMWARREINNRRLGRAKRESRWGVEEAELKLWYSYIATRILSILVCIFFSLFREIN